MLGVIEAGRAPREELARGERAVCASTTRIGSELYISVKTVKNHLANIFDKLDVRDRTQAVLQGLRLGLVHLR